MEGYKELYKAQKLVTKQLEEENSELKDINKKLENKLMYALSPTNHELSNKTQENFKKIIRKNLNEDTHTIKRELKKYWNNDVEYKGWWTNE